MAFVLREVGPDGLDRVAAVPMTVHVERILVLEPVEGGLGGIRLVERGVAAPYVKDYDMLDPPASWRLEPDIADWHIVLALDGDAAIGAAATRPVEGATEIATLWNIRVRADARRRGVGLALLADARAWAASGGARWLKAETQNVNVPACRFYRATGATLGAVDRFLYAAYPEVAHEVALEWYFDLSAP